jgi:plastocyanin
MGRRAVVALAIVAGLVGAACSSGGSSSSTSGGGGSSGGGTTTLEQGPNDQLVFSPTTLTVAKGTTITVKNVSSSIPHTFTVTGQSINITNNGGESKQVPIDLPPGTYPFVCTFHESQGMKGTLTVTG